MMGMRKEVFSFVFHSLFPLTFADDVSDLEKTFQNTPENNV